MSKKGILLLAGMGALAWVLYREKPSFYDAIYDAVESDSGNVTGGFIKASLGNVADNVEGYFVSSPNENLIPSMQLINFTKNYEKFEAYPYYATAVEKTKGLQTIGYGHLIIGSDNFSYPMTKEVADALFMSDLNKHIAQIYTKIKVKLSQNQFDALCDFCFNAGAGALKVYSTLTELINDEKFDEAANRFMSYTTQGGNVVAGLMNRRYSEMNMFRFGKYERYTGFNSANT